MDQYRLQAKRGDGTFSQVFMAYSLKTGKYVAIKCMKKKFQTIQKVKKLKEIQALKLLSPHQNIIKLIEVLYDEPTGNFQYNSGKLALVFELMEQNLYECLVKRKNLSMQKVKYYMYLLLRSISYIHKKGIFHRDIKPQNVLITGDVIKLADFGSCKGIYSKHPYTEYISTRWYRAPECLMTDGYYDSKMDVWGYGCVLFEMVTKYPLFNGSSQLDQIHRINKVLGPPSPELLNKFKTKATHMKPNDWNFPPKKGIGLEKLMSNANASKQLISLLYKLLDYDPAKRITADEALQHEYFAEFVEASTRKFRSTIFGLPASFSQNKSQKNDDTPEKYKIKENKRKKEVLKKQNSKAIIEEETNSLPPIHQLRLDVKFNLYGSTVKTHDNIFKKTLANISKKKEENYMITGKKF